MKSLALLLGLTLAAPTLAQEIVTVPFDGTPDDADFTVTAAIQGEGLVIDYTAQVGEMMARTGADLGLGPSPVGDGARSYQFCSATISRQVMEANPLNVGHCPYSIFIAEIGGETVVGYRSFSEPTMAPVNELLARIVAAATE